MRSYIFTDRERRIIEGFLKGEVGGSDPSIQQIKSRMKSFRRLARDVELYLALKRRFAEPKPAVSA